MRKLNDKLFEKNKVQSNELSQLKGGREIIDVCETAGGLAGDGREVEFDYCRVYDDGTFDHTFGY
ncbi:hypothetical protein [Marinifilum caeruleilacunae]|uniref:Bacteriocin n=1 Tax=Marinifilum caeruleilacunae TaxID=2499076 RepID=A0ABX1X1G0_9BACT|nr:hypothetical protein [Marinifilum caeruleilacunae]NOU62249.1 hypothetical protein [Marinifilum caeruleilacunae]